MADTLSLSKAVVVQTQEEERYRLSRALQSGPAQVLANAALEIETCLRLMDEQPAAVREGLVALLAELRQGLSDVRNLIADLQPPLLAELGLAASVQKYANDFASRTGIVTTLSGWDGLKERLPATMEMAAFRIVQEALENVHTHARATSVQINLERTPEQFIVTVADNGQGFAALNEMVAPGRRLGLVAMRDRAELLGGQLQIFSEPARGSRVVLTVPRYAQTA